MCVIGVVAHSFLFGVMWNMVDVVPLYTDNPAALVVQRVVFLPSATRMTEDQIAGILQAKGPGVLGTLTFASASDGLVDGITIALEVAHTRGSN
jgi:hypothetical protein